MSRNGVYPHPRHTLGVTGIHHRPVMNSNTPCPTCASRSSKRIIWTNDLSEAGIVVDPEAVALAGSRRWNDTPGPDRMCSACGRRFCSDPAEQRRFDEETKRRFRRLDELDRENSLWFEPRTPLDQVAGALLRRLRLASDDGDGEPACRKL